MCSMSVLCPLCAQTSFSSIDALRNSLIKVANGPLPCPICRESFLGLDKLTIHLFSHTNLMTHATVDDEAKVTPTSAPAPQQQEPQAKEPSGEVAVKKSNEMEKKLKKTRQKCAPKPKEVQQQAQFINSNNDTNTTNMPTAPTAPINSVEPIKTEVQAVETSSLSTCDVCEFTFRNEQLRDMHFRLVHQNSPSSPPMNVRISETLTTAEPDFKCHLCAKTFKMKGSLRVHLKVVHMMGLPYVNNTPKLSICDRIRHKEIKTHHSSKAMALNMPIQQQQQPLQQNQILAAPQHIQQNLTILSNSSNSPNLVHLSNLADVGAQIITNSPQTLPNVDASILDANFVVFVSSSPQTSNEANKDITPIKPALLDNPKIWECDVCSKSFTTKYFLKKHKRLHTGEMPYTCEICARTFTFQQSYHKHLLYHSDEKPHICATCGRAFKELSTLHNHERIHSGEKPFKCEICGKSFRQRVSFLVHTRIHTGHMPYKCDMCQKNFRYKVSLRTHKCQPTTVIQEEIPDNTTEPLASTGNMNAASEHLTETFIKAFLESTTNNADAIEREAQNSPGGIELAAINEAVIDSKSVEALLSQTIDDIIVESCNKLGIGSDNNNINKAMTMSPKNLISPHMTPSPTAMHQQLSMHNSFSDGSNSPLQKLRDMRLYSPKFELENLNLNEDSGEFSHFFTTK